MRKLLLAVLALSWVPSVHADFHAGPGILGDEDPFPLSCINFTGDWTADDGQEYLVDQQQCRMIQIHAGVSGAMNQTTTIVPDNKSRLIRGPEWKGFVRHRWNDKNYGSIIQSYKNMDYSDRSISEVLTLEIVNENLLLESTYRTIYPDQGPARREYQQKVFRKATRTR